MRSNKRHIRELLLYGELEEIEYELLDIVLDFRSPVPLADLDDWGEEGSEDDSDSDGDYDEKIKVKPGPDRPAMVAFQFTGTMDMLIRFYDILYNLTSLVDLNLNLWEYSQEVKTNDVNVERLLECMPNLSYLSIFNCDYKLPHLQTSALFQPSLPSYRLRTYRFQTNLIDTTKEEYFRLFQRHGNLTSIHIRGYATYVDGFLKRYMPGALTWALRQFCQQLEDFRVDGNIPLELYRLTTPLVQPQLCNGRAKIYRKQTWHWQPWSNPKRRTRRFFQA